MALQRLRARDDPADIQLYLDRYPGGTYAASARNRLKLLEASAKVTKPSATPAPRMPSVSTRMEEARLAAEAKFRALVEESEASDDFEAYLEHYPDGDQALWHGSSKSWPRGEPSDKPQKAIAAWPLPG